jgi:hypothetical protein
VSVVCLHARHESVGERLHGEGLGLEAVPESGELVGQCPEQDGLGLRKLRGAALGRLDQRAYGLREAVRTVCQWGAWGGIGV